MSENEDRKLPEGAERPKGATEKPAAPGNAAVECVQAGVASDALKASTPEQRYAELNAKGYEFLRDGKVTAFNVLRKKNPGWIPNLTRADLTRADLRGADLTRAILIGAILTGADLRGADLSRAILSGAILTGADLTEAILFRAILTEAILSRANLTRADLRGADLSRANLTRADLRGAYLSRAYLSRAILRGIKSATAEQLAQANLIDTIWSDKVLRDAAFAAQKKSTKIVPD